MVTSLIFMDGFIDPFQPEFIPVNSDIARIEEMVKDLKEKIEELITKQKVLEERLTTHRHCYARSDEISIPLGQTYMASFRT